MLTSYIALVNSSKIPFYAIIIALILSAAAQESIANSYLFEKQKNITIASEPDYPPYCFVNKNGIADGFAIDLFKASASAVGLIPNIKIGVWNKIKQDLADGNIDALPLVGRTPERESLFDFTLPYLTLHGAIFVRSSDNNIHSINDLKNKSILVMKGDNAEEFVRRENLSQNIITTNTFSDALILLNQGEYDAVIMQEVMGLKLLEELKINSIVVSSVELPKYRQDFCFAVKKGNKELLSLLNEGLSIIIANKTYYNIHNKWFGPQQKNNISPLQIFLYLLYLLIPISIVLTIVFIITLRRQVTLKTKSLNQEIQIRLYNEQKNELYSRVLELYHKHDISKNLIKDIIRLIQDYSKCEAVGIRLNKQNDYSYFDSLGFSQEHLKFVNNLCSFEIKEQVENDTPDNPFLNCICGKIISGKFDPSDPCFTPNGSYWSNSTTRLLESISEKKLQSPNTKRCIGEGYESLALITRIGEHGNIGLLYLNDGRTNRFTLENIKFFEDLTEAIAIALSGKKAEEDLLIAKEKAEQSENRLQLAAESGKFGIWDWNVKDNVMVWDNRMFELYGISQNAFPNTVDAWLNGLHPQDKQRAIDECYAALNGEKDFNTTFRVLHPDGKILYLNAHALVIRDSNGKAIRMIGLNADVTEIQLAQIELEKHRYHLEDLVESRTQQVESINKELVSEIDRRKETELLLQESLSKEIELNLLKSRFISTASHEFRTPLTAILSSIELLQRYFNKWNADKREEHIERIKSSVEYLTKLMDDVITVNRDESGKTIFSPSLCNLKNIFESIIEESELNSKNDCSFVFNYKANNLHFYLDSKQITIIIQNLITNSVKYSPSGGKIEISVSENSDQLIINVSDNGIGIPENDLPKIFDTFHRASNVGEIRGTGLGLHIVKHAVLLHGGKIEVNSTIGKGTKFTVTIPIPN